MKLDKIINFYLRQSKKKIIFSDSENSYSIDEFKKKIFFYKNEISIAKRMLNLNGNDNIGFAILLERGVDYFCIIFAAWLSGCYYLPLSTNTKKENLRYHQTNLGGSLHSDGPQLPVPPKYVLMCCLNQAKKGGSSIIVSMENT